MSDRVSPKNMADVPVHVAVEMGRTTRQLHRAIALNPGEVIELDREISAPVDIVVDGVQYGRGELMNINGNWALRIVEIKHAPAPASE